MLRWYLAIALLAGSLVIAGGVFSFPYETGSAVAASPPIWFALGTGLYRSDDDGATLTYVDINVDNPNLRLPTGSGVSAVAVDPQNPNNIYVVAKGNNGLAIYRSTDQGKSWSVNNTLLDSYPPAQNGTDPNGPTASATHPWDPMQCVLCIDTANPKYWYMGYWRSIDAGSTWSRMIESHTNYDLWGLAVDPGVSGLVYSAFGPNILVSRDYGATFTTVAGDTHAGFVFVDPTNGDVYGERYGTNSNCKCTIDKSSDNGQTWTGLSLAGAVSSVAFDSTSGDVYVDGTGIYKSSDKGNTFHLQRPGGWDIYSQLVADPNVSGHLFLSDRKQGNSYVLSTDGGQTFSSNAVNVPLPCIPATVNGKPGCTYPSITFNTLQNVAFTISPPAQRQAAPVAESAARPAPPSQPAAPPQPNLTPSGLQLIQSPDGTYYFVQNEYYWVLAPDSISDDELSGYTILDQWSTVHVSQLQPGTVRMVLGPDGTLYLLQEANGWVLIAISAAAPGSIATNRLGANLTSTLPIEFFTTPMTFVLLTTPATSEPSAPAPGEAGPPSTLTESVRQDIVNAVINANAYWSQAQSTADASHLGNALAGQELADDIAAINKLRSAGHSQKLYQNAFNVTDVTIDAPGHAIVHTTETWSGEIDSLSTGQLVQRLPPTTYIETYTVEFQNGGWIVTLDQLQQV